MNSNTDRLRRFPARAAAVATFAAVALGAAACGTETASDGQPGAPAAPAAKVQVKSHAPTSADAAEHRARAEQLEQFRRHLEDAAQ
ncbi:MAG TPA: hypothetical protein VFV89_15730 [Nocardioides sp.]|uniref:hypothetical protein n=1 Tax=Nocardioides sp. TaxID=35761 RepID=UPI002E35EB06|nr:hypothetical protein [Nocardioides sp.]HEX5089259.1 hypothetical protein [Nocardioides sp.]